MQPYKGYSIAGSALQLFLFGGLMALGSAAFAAANWALTADVAPPHEAARFLGLANIGTTGAEACSRRTSRFLKGHSYTDAGAAREPRVEAAGKSARRGPFVGGARRLPARTALAGRVAPEAVAAENSVVT